MQTPKIVVTYAVQRFLIHVGSFKVQYISLYSGSAIVAIIAGLGMYSISGSRRCCHVNNNKLTVPGPNLPIKR
jgi:hypothetical protein